MNKNNQNQESIIDLININKKILPISYLFIKEVQPTYVSHGYAKSKKYNNSYFKVGVYYKLISISFLDEK